MAIKPKSVRRPWEPAPVNYNSMAGQGRKNNEVSQAFYRSSAWRSIRSYKLKINPLCECERCKLQHRVLPAKVVDHVKQVNPENPYDTQNGKYGDPFNIKNLMSMSVNCHNRKSAIERHNKI